MGSWREVAAAARQQQGEQSAPPIDSFGLPDALATALRRLEHMPPPRKLETPANWRGVVNDALTIARDGWAAKAMALGWSAGDLFGIGPRDDWDFEGVAVWIDGRRIAVLDEARIIATDARGDRRGVFVRGGAQHGKMPTITPVMLWDFGR